MSINWRKNITTCIGECYNMHTIINNYPDLYEERDRHMGFCDSEIYTHYKSLASKYTEPSDSDEEEEYQSETDDIKTEAANWFMSMFSTNIGTQWKLAYIGRYKDDPRVIEDARKPIAKDNSDSEDNSDDNSDEDEEESQKKKKDDFFCRWYDNDVAGQVTNAEMGYWTDGQDYWLIVANSSQFFTISCIGGHPDLRSNAISFVNSDGSTLNENLLQKEDILKMSGDEVIDHFRSIAYDYVVNQNH